jgi:transposase
MKKQMRYSPEVRERAVRLLREHQGEYASEWASTGIDSIQDWL